jgi:hypothetical protein
MKAAWILILMLAAIPALAAPADTTLAATPDSGSAPGDPAPAETPENPASGTAPEASSPAEASPGDSTPARPPRGARLFETLEFAGEAGILVPLGDLADLLDPAPLLGARFTTSYYRSWKAYASLSASRVENAPNQAAIALAIAAAGLEARPGPAWIPNPGLGLSLAYIRILSRDEGQDEYLFMDDGESEFGLQGSLRWIVPLGSRLSLQAGGRWDLMFTGPEYSHAASALVGASGTW